ncbi:MAG: DUF1573 domain-containing protein [Candidatus Kapabacteria bacterium]|nr:DUF1573 domain-containing protein [Candidatus Kapabacteria bacterium]
MKKISLIALAILLFAFKINAQPKLEFIEEGNFKGDRYNWGKVKEKESPLKANIRIKNTGNQLLDITKVKPGCGCTTAPLDKDKLQPGEVATIKVELRVTGHPGPVAKSITVSSNDLSNPERNIFLEADLVKPILNDPQYLTFQADMKVGIEAESKVKITNASPKSVTLSDFVVKPETGICNMTGKKVLAPNESIEVSVKYTPTKAGYISLSLELKTDDADQPSIYVAGYGNAVESPLFNQQSATPTIKK